MDRWVDGIDAYVFVIPGSAFQQIGFNHNYRFTRRFNSPSSGGLNAMLLPDDPVRGAVSPFAYGIWTGDPGRFAMEREAELVRRHAAPERISRLDGVFFFADPESCQRVSHQWGWNLSTVRRGRAHGKADRYDMVVSSALMPPSRVAGHDARERLWRHYFSGLPGAEHADLPDDQRGAPPIWEYLISGYIEFEVDDSSPFLS
jgi:hypothetical protein